MKKILKPLNNDHSIQSDKIKIYPTKNTQITPQLDPLFNLLDTPVFITDGFGNIIDVNEPFCKLTGYIKMELTGKNFTTIFFSNNGNPKVEHDPASILNYTILPDQLSFRHKNHSVLNFTLQYKSLKDAYPKPYFLISVKNFETIQKQEFKNTDPIKSDDGKENAIFNSNQNIHESEEIEKKLLKNSQRSLALEEINLDALIILDSAANSLYTSPNFLKVLGYSDAESLSLNFFMLLHPEDINDFKKIWKSVLEEKNNPKHAYRYRILHKDTSWRWIENTFTNMLQHTAIKGIVIKFKEIIKSATAEENFNRFEENFKSIFENSKDGYILLNKAHTVIAFNEKARENNFLIKQVTEGASIYNFVEKDRISYFKNIIDNAFKGESFQYERPANNKITNEALWIHLSINPIFENGNVKTVCITATNITNQKIAENQLNQSRNLLKRAESIAKIGSAEFNFSTNNRFWSDEYYRILGLEPGSIQPSIDGIVEFLHPEEKEPYSKWLISGLSNKIAFQQIETRIITAAGELRNIRAYKSTTFTADGKPTVLIGVIQDITERKVLELQLEESKEIYQSLFYQNPTAVFSLDLEGNFTSANHILALKTECIEEEIMKLHYLDFVHPEDKETTKIHFENTKQGQTQEYAIRILTAKGHKIIAAIISLPIIINNKITGVYCLANDITSDINAKMILNKTLADRQRILDYSLDVICEIDRNGKFIQVSKACKQLWGYTEEEMIGKNYIDMVWEMDLEVTIKMAAVITAGGPVTRNFENRYIKKDGSVVNLIWSVGWDVTEKIMYCIARDATEIKEQKKALVLSEQRYKDLFNHNPLPLYIFNFNTHFIVEVNNAALKKYGYTREEFLFLTVSDFCTQKELAVFEKMLKDDKSFSMVSKKTWMHVKKNGEIMHLNISGNIIDYNGKKSVLTLLDDVTDKIKAAEQKEFDRIDKEALINGTNDDIWSISKDFNLIAGNKAFIKNLKLTAGINIKPGDSVIASGKMKDEVRTVWQEMYLKALKGKPFKKELVQNDPLTNLKQWSEVSFNPIFNGKNITGIACYCRDITENKLNHNELLHINKKLEMAQRMAKLGYYEFNILESSSFWSKEMYNIFEIKKTKTPVSYSQIINAVHPEDKQKVVDNYELAIEKRQQLNIEHRIILKDGSVKFLVQKGTLKLNEVGAAYAFEGTLQDITQSKLAEQAVKDSEEKYRKIFNSTPLPNWIYDIETLKILKANNAATTFYGYKSNEFLKMLITDLFISKDKIAADVFKNDGKITTGGIINFGHWQQATKTGKIINVTINGHSIFYNDKNAVMIVANDITEIVKSQQALAKSNERFEYATKATFDAIWDMDIVNKSMFWGEGFNTLFGYNLKELEKNNLERENLIHPDDKERVRKSLKELIDNRHQIYWKSQYQFLKKNGDYASVIDCALVVRDKNGIPYRVIGAMQDITDRIKNEVILKELNAQLNKRAAQLANSNAELEQFAYIASHDLQEPLRMVTSFLKRIQKKYEYQLDDTGKSYINFAVDGAVRMRQIILDLLEYSRVGTQQYQLEKINTNRLVDEVISIYINIKQPQKIEITHNNLPEIVAAKTPVHQLFQNLISNAVKYQNPETISKIYITGKENADHWYFSIEDNGIGISVENFNKIFILFRRLHNKEQYSGTGIGLAICKKIINNHKGKLWVSSVPGKGSTFYFTISKTILN